jgi:hypothetical protein
MAAFFFRSNAIAVGSAVIQSQSNGLCQSMMSSTNWFVRRLQNKMQHLRSEFGVKPTPNVIKILYLNKRGTPLSINVVLFLVGDKTFSEEKRGGTDTLYVIIRGLGSDSRRARGKGQS